jgi:hypothetical protein
MAKTIFRKEDKWAYVGSIYGNGRKYGYYVASGKGTTNWYKKNKSFKKGTKASALKYAKRLIK